jgi:uncharacterized protein YecA (UPF0149 family)
MSDSTHHDTQKTGDYLPQSNYVPKDLIVEKMKSLIEEKKEEQLERERLASMPKVPFVREEPRVGRNDPCTCGSGKKYKKCCGAAE